MILILAIVSLYHWKISKINNTIDTTEIEKNNDV